MNIDAEYAIKKDIRNNPIVRELDRGHGRDLVRAISLAAAVVAMVLFSMWQQFGMLQSGLDMTALQAQLAAAEARNRQLTLEVTSWRTPEYIELLATRDLHMVAPTSAETIILERLPAGTKPSAAIVARAR